MPRPLIETLAPGDAAAFVAHLRRHLSENGAHGVIYAPVDARDVGDSPTELHKRAVAWARCLTRKLDKPDWRRVLVIRDPALSREVRARQPDRGIVAHLDLRSGALRTELHRCSVAMGMYEPFRGRGWGRALLQEAIAWAQRQPGLDWMDLGVFSQNGGARYLYESTGFRETGRVVDRFRVQGGSVDDVQMTLRLR